MKVDFVVAKLTPIFFFAAAKVKLSAPQSASVQLAASVAAATLENYGSDRQRYIGDDSHTEHAI